jgi:protein-tyrosine phosphatase
MITKVWERALYVASLKDAAQLASANLMKIAAVLSLCPEQIEQRSPGIHYMRLPIADAQPISARQFEEILAALERGLQPGSLLVHCVAGFSRSPILASAWMDRRGDLGLEAALREIAAIRTIDPIHKGASGQTMKDANDDSPPAASPNGGRPRARSSVVEDCWLPPR